MAADSDDNSRWRERVHETNSDQREELSAARTEMSEDRTVLAMERTFAGWFRSSLAAVGIGLGFQALFTRMDPHWVPKAIATAFMLIAIALLISGERRACEVLSHLDTHEVHAVRRQRLRLLAWVTSAVIVVLIAAMWLLRIES